MQFFLVCVVLSTAQVDNQRSHLSLPLHGTLKGQRVFGFFGEPKDHSTLFSVGPQRDDRTRVVKYWFQLEAGLDLWYRHKFDENALWLSVGPLCGIRRVPYEDLECFNESNIQGYNTLLRKYNNQLFEPGAFHLPGLANKDRANYEGALLGPAQGIAGFGIVPIATDVCKIFQLSKKNKNFEAWETQGFFNDKTKRWEVLRDERNLESFPSPFLEDFYVFVRRQDYYFVTESGQLFYAPPRKDGERMRSVKALWEDEKKPIVAILEDADRDRVWLFAKDKRAGAVLDYFFELKASLRPETFDPTKLRPAQINNRAKLLLEYLPLISIAEMK